MQNPAEALKDDSLKSVSGQNEMCYSFNPANVGHESKHFWGALGCLFYVQVHGAATIVGGKTEQNAYRMEFFSAPLWLWLVITGTNNHFHVSSLEEPWLVLLSG